MGDHHSLLPTASAQLVRGGEISPAILAGQLAPSSIAKYHQDFAAFAAFASAALQDAATLARWRAHLADATTYSPHTINRMLAAVKRVMKEAAAQGYTGHEVAAAFDRVDGVKPRALRHRLKRHSRRALHSRGLAVSRQRRGESRAGAIAKVRAPSCAENDHR